MNILIVGAVFAVLLLFVPNLLNRQREAMLAQYKILEKRFWLRRKTYPSKWGKGIGERYALSGEFRGYPLALYDHYRGSGKMKVTWTSLTLEMLFAGELEFTLESESGDAAAHYSRSRQNADSICKIGGFLVFSDSISMGKNLIDDTLKERIAGFDGEGSFRLSKGFFEYRESALMTDERMRLRFQDAMGIIADVGDHLAELVNKQDQST